MSILKNSSIIVAGIIISNALAYIFHIYVGRSLGPADYGIFGALIALMTILSLPSSAFGSGVVKYSAKLNEKKEYGKIGFLRRMMQDRMLLFGAIVLLFIVMLSSAIANYLNISSNVSVMVMGVSLIFALISPINRGVLQGMKKYKAYSLNAIIESSSRLVLVIGLLFLGLKVNGAVLAYGLAYFIAFLAIFPLIKETKKKQKFEINGFYRFVILVFFVNLIIQLIINAPTIFIKHFFSSEFTGLWNAALTLSRVSIFVTTGISLVMFSEVAGSDNIKRKRSIFKKTLFLTIVASVGIALIFWLVPGIFISLLYGSAYLGAVPILQWMSVAMIFIAVIQLCASYWMASLRGENGK
ncbi:MAG: oligosaccharide flippase family protein [Candidatus Pacearchaeota archaeon]